MFILYRHTNIRSEKGCVRYGLQCAKLLRWRAAAPWARSSAYASRSGLFAVPDLRTPPRRGAGPCTVDPDKQGTLSACGQSRPENVPRLPPSFRQRRPQGEHSLHGAREPRPGPLPQVSSVPASSPSIPGWKQSRARDGTHPGILSPRKPRCLIDRLAAMPSGASRFRTMT